MNLLMITADDMSYSSLGFAGCEFQNITPNLDHLAESSVFFKNAHTVVSLCQPSRSVWMTGKYPWNNGALGFQDVQDNVTTFVEILKDHGYQTGIIGKVCHLSPIRKFPWDMVQRGYGEGEPGKNPDTFYKFCTDFLKSVDGPFFLMANSHHPHRGFPQTSRFNWHNVVVPGFLADRNGVKKEMSRYYEGVCQCDVIVGQVIRALRETGHDQDTIVVFTSDHGMAFPFVKANCYHYGTKVPLIFKVPGVRPSLYPHITSSIDLMPTLLNLLDIDCPDVDGRSYMNEMLANNPNRDWVYSCLVRLYNGEFYQTRSLFNEKFCYIVNGWAGEKLFREDGCLNDNEPAVKSLSKHRRNLLRHRVGEEFYYIEKDPFALKNMVDSTDLCDIKRKMQSFAWECNDEFALQFLNKFGKLMVPF